MTRGVLAHAISPLVGWKEGAIHGSLHRPVLPVSALLTPPPTLLPAPKVLYVLVLVAIATLWLPSKNATRYAYHQELKTFDDDDDGGGDDDDVGMLRGYAPKAGPSFGDDDMDAE